MDTKERGGENSLSSIIISSTAWTKSVALIADAVPAIYVIAEKF
jgi:hypothetical protein